MPVVAAVIRLELLRRIISLVISASDLTNGGLVDWENALSLYDLARALASSACSCCYLRIWPWFCAEFLAESNLLFWINCRRSSLCYYCLLANEYIDDSRYCSGVQLYAWIGPLLNIRCADDKPWVSFLWIVFLPYELKEKSEWILDWSLEAVFCLLTAIESWVFEIEILDEPIFRILFWEF